MIEFETLVWGKNFIAAEEAETEINGYRLTIYREEDTQKWILLAQDLENRNRYANSTSTQTWPLLDELFGRKNWQWFLQDCEERREIYEMAHFHRVLIDIVEGEAVILKPGRQSNDTPGWCGNADVYDEIPSYTEAYSLLEYETDAQELELVRDEHGAEYYRIHEW